MVIAKTASSSSSRNVVYKANKLGESMFARQSEMLMLMPEEELGSQSPVSNEEDFEDLSSNADLYVFNDQMVQGYSYRGVNINTRDNEESLGENVPPCRQTKCPHTSLSLYIVSAVAGTSLERLIYNAKLI